jgi:hypothetical protein
MATASVGITFETASMADAEAKIAAWTLHEGCQVTVNVTESSDVGVIDAEGNLIKPEPPPEMV